MDELTSALARDGRGFAALEQGCRNREISLTYAKAFFIFDPSRASASRSSCASFASPNLD
jgi:hypothetical protein